MLWNDWHFFVVVNHPYKSGPYGLLAMPGPCFEAPFTPPKTPREQYSHYKFADIDGDGKDELLVWNVFNLSQGVEIVFIPPPVHCTY
ncbi:MAG TPA: hypothetical protein VMO26_19420 [Vicinamibacterales bacterium]|nr:hypothetical protein [Vicinamibacterales bacterium]